MPVICRGITTKKEPQEFKFSLGDFFSRDEILFLGFSVLCFVCVCVVFFFNPSIKSNLLSFS